jgi:LacI family transcriptional regulator
MGKFLCHEGNILVFSASNDVYASKQKLLGFKDRIKSSYPKMRILKSINYADDEENCYNLIMKELKYNPEISGIYATSGISSLAISKALKDLDLDSSPKFIGYDPSKVLSQYMIDGYVNALIYQDPFTQGYLSIKILYDFVAHGIVPEKETLNTKFEIVVQENLENFINITS